MGISRLPAKEEREPSDSVPCWLQSQPRRPDWEGLREEWLVHGRTALQSMLRYWPPDTMASTAPPALASCSATTDLGDPESLPAFTWLTLDTAEQRPGLGGGPLWTLATAKEPCRGHQSGRGPLQKAAGEGALSAARKPSQPEAWQPGGHPAMSLRVWFGGPLRPRAKGLGIL